MQPRRRMTQRLHTGTRAEIRRWQDFTEILNEWFAWALCRLWNKLPEEQGFELIHHFKIKLRIFKIKTRIAKIKTRKPVKS
ncbi:unnamed protein product [Phytophthora fragariaefolia]|uniref:Unnamed protein product n=1 Tax=Phytophthora fragariaefolia TaxID=1490495 RepID=A0A9W6YEF5_9STRA|nr:unnamed protein product [Phytophthora fragariaefolia]